jgi:membrane-associated phospholipid phosphatase
VPPIASSLKAQVKYLNYLIIGPRVPPLNLSILRQRAARLVILLVCVGLLAFTIDVPIALLTSTHPLPKEISNILRLAEIGGHGTGAAMILIAALAIKQINWRKKRDRLIACQLIAGSYLGALIVDLLKLTINRVRPHSALLNLRTSFLDTFGQELLKPDSVSRSALMSFPSGHAAVAAGLAVSLCWFYPRGRSVFIALAILASFQRVNSLSHFLSDICIGAAIGIAGALVFAPTPDHADRGQ